MWQQSASPSSLTSVQLFDSSSMSIIFTGNVSAILDTGTSLIAGPTSLIQQINAQIGAQTYVSGWMSLNCSNLSTLPTVQFSLGGHNFTLDAEDYVIQVRIIDN
jgi:hypothetical protein